MRAVKGKDSKLEIVFRKYLWKEGIRYRKNVSSYFGTPDLVLKKYKTVIFLDSCFWHGCPKHYKAPKIKRIFWNRKIEKNRIRDKKVNNHYKQIGWKVIRIWEHDVKKEIDLTRKIRYVIRKLTNEGHNFS